MARPSRLELQAVLEAILGTRNVFFQPKEGQNLEYPAIVYTIDSAKVEYGDDRPYKIHDRYQVTYIDRSPDSEIPRKIQELPMTRFTSYFAMDGLNHYNHSIYY